ncbi:MAG: DUF5132 domain-containing protein [Spirulina sp.]
MAFKPSDITDFFGDFIGDFGLPGVVIGVGAIALAPIVGPALAKAGKPVAKAIVKGSLVAYEKGKGAFAEAKESLEDLVMESRAELAEAEEKKILEPAADVIVEAEAEAG